MSAPEATEDPELQAVAWDLDPLLDGRADDPDAAVGEMLAEVQRRADAFAEAHAGKVAELDGAGLVAALRELEAIQELLGRAGSYAILNFSGDTADPARGALLQKLQEGSTAIETRLLFFELEWAALDDDRAEELLADRRARLRAPPPAHRPPLPPAPALRARGEDPRREGAHRPHRVDAAVRGAGVGDHRPARGGRRAGLARGRALAASSRPTATSAATPPSASPRRSSPACARAPTCSTRCSPTRWSRTGCATTRTGWPAATSPTRPPTSRSRRWSPRSATATSCRAAGTASRPACSALDRLADYDRMAAVTDEQEHVDWASAKETVLSTYGAFSDELGALVQRFFDESWIDAPVRPNKRGGAFCAYTVPSLAPVRAAQLHLHAPRRAHARARARPRRPRRARRAPGHLPHGDPADHGRDRQRVRRDARLRPPARAGRDRRSRASRCWPRASRARSPPSSARSR